MRETVRTLLFGLAAGTALTWLSTAPAAADQMVMPFSCGVIGGQVSLAPSAPQTYQIYGRAEHKRLTTCSPYDRRKCHNWSVHRFDLDCGGVRTSWQSVVAALSPILAESAGEAYAPYGGPAYGDRAGRYRQGAGGGIAFPRGFAPNPMNVAQFKRTAPAVAETPPTAQEAGGGAGVIGGSSRRSRYKSRDGRIRTARPGPDHPRTGRDARDTVNALDGRPSRHRERDPRPTRPRPRRKRRTLPGIAL